MTATRGGWPCGRPSRTGCLVVPTPHRSPHIRPRAGAQRAFAKGIGSFVTPARRSWARCREGQGVRGDKQRAAAAGGPGDGRYPSAAAQAVFVRLVPPAAVGVALMEAEGRVTQRAALPPSLPGEAGPRLLADRPPATGRAAGHGEDHRAGAATALLPLPPCAAGTDPKAPAPGSRATSFLRPKLPTHAVESTRLPARGALALRRWPRLNSNWATPLEATLSRTRPGGASGTCARGPRVCRKPGPPTCTCAGDSPPASPLPCREAPPSPSLGGLPHACPVTEPTGPRPPVLPLAATTLCIH